MEFGLSRNWWVLVVRGLLAILFGILAFFWPGLTLYVLIIFFGAYALVDGAFAIAAAVTGHHEGRQWWTLLLEGLLGLIVGAVTFLWPGITGLALVYIIAFWAIATGVFEIMAAIRLRKYIEGEWALALAGALSILFGLLIAIVPGAGALGIVWLIAAYAIVFGALLVILGFQLRNWRRHADTMAGHFPVA